MLDKSVVGRWWSVGLVSDPLAICCYPVSVRYQTNLRVLVGRQTVEETKVG